MTYKNQAAYVAGYLEGKYEVETEVELGQGLWCGIRTDVVIRDHPSFPRGLGIELKWQDTTGSAHYKIPHAVLTIKRHYTIPGCLVVSGGHSGIMDALEWAKGEVDEPGGTFVGAFTTDEFFSWLKRQ